MAIDKVFYVEEWNTKYTVYRVKADSEAGVKDIYWDETDERGQKVISILGKLNMHL